MGHKDLATVTATEVRKGTCTLVGRTEDKATARKGASHMTHKPSTAQAHYCQLQGTATSLEAYQIINRKREAESEDQADEEPPLQPSKKRSRKAWAQEEEEALTAHFSLEADSKPPSVPRCREFLGECRATKSPLFAGRDAKDIKDKCRTLLRALNREQS